MWRLPTFTPLANSKSMKEFVEIIRIPPSAFFCEWKA
jgi:hypothetical protein